MAADRGNSGDYNHRARIRARHCVAHSCWIGTRGGGRMKGRRRVVITGIGAITPIGSTKDAMWDGVLRERSAVRSLTRFDPSIFRSHNAAEVPDFDPNDFIESKRAKRLDRFG